MKDEEKLNLPVIWPEKLACSISAELAKLPIQTFQLSGMPGGPSPHYRMMVIFNEKAGIPDYDTDGFEFPTAEAVLEDVKKYVKGFEDLKLLDNLLYHVTGHTHFPTYLSSETGVFALGTYATTSQVRNRFRAWNVPNGPQQISVITYPELDITESLIEKYLSKQPELIRVTDMGGYIFWHALRPGHKLYVPKEEKPAN